MRRSTILILVSLLLVSVVGYLLPEKDAGTTDRILMRNLGGRVVFDHKTHAESYGLQCITCHHDAAAHDKAGRNCRDCHGASMDAGFVRSHQTAFAGASECAACHHVAMEPKKGWHEFHAASVDPDCRKCHHEDRSIEPEPRRCADCHLSDKAQGPILALKDAAHARCSSCHESVFKDGEGRKYCTVCHERADSGRKALAGEGIGSALTKCSLCHEKEPKKLVRGSMEAFHGLCIGCHTKKGGPVDNCAQCHTK
ncbi:MAG: cytochrome c family protein [Mailhella sp.]|nr:cytochrome c family protein [Mailhella sp.]